MTPQPNGHPHQPSRSIPLIFFASVVIVLLVPLILLGLPLYWLYGQWLKARWNLTWGRRGKRVLLVYSRSPHWQQHIEGSWLPRLGPHAVVLNWSDRNTWPQRAPLEVRAFRYWGGYREFNPLAVLFPKSGKVKVVRFWRAFHDFKHGREAALREAENALFGFVAEIEGDAA